MIGIVKSTKYRQVFGDDPLKTRNVREKANRALDAPIERVKFYPSPDFTENTIQKLNKNPSLSMNPNQMQRIKNEYNEIRNNYQRTFGYY